VLQGLAEGVPGRLQELTSFNVLTSKDLPTAARGSSCQVTLTAGLLFARAPHGL